MDLCPPDLCFLGRIFQLMCISFCFEQNSLINSTIFLSLFNRATKEARFVCHWRLLGDFTYYLAQANRKKKLCIRGRWPNIFLICWAHLKALWILINWKILIESVFVAYVHQPKDVASCFKVKALSSIWELRGKRNIVLEERNKRWEREMWPLGPNLKNHQQYRSVWSTWNYKVN